MLTTVGLALVITALGASQASLIIPWLNLTITCVTVGKYLGPQTPETPTIAPMLLLGESPCSDLAQAETLRGRAVFFRHEARCGDADAFAALSRHGVRAIVKSSPFPYPENDWYTRPPPEAAATDVVMVKYTSPAELMAAMAAACPGANCTVQVRPDPNPYILRQRTWAFQLIDVWVPGVLDLGGALVALAFCLSYGRALTQSSQRRPPTSLGSTGGHVQLNLRPMRYYPLVVLVLCLLVGLIMGLYRVVGGSDSTGLLPVRLDRLFASQLAGLQFTATILAARFWSFMINPIQALPNSVVRRFLIGANPRADVVLFSLLIGFDMFLAVGLTFYWNYDEQPLFVVGLVAYSAIELLLAIWITLASARAMSRFLLSGQMLDVMTPERRSFALRITWCAFGAGLSHLYYLVMALTLLLQSDYFFSPNGLTYINGGYFLAKALQNAFVIYMFRPKSANGHTVGGIIRSLFAPVLTTAVVRVPAPSTDVL